MLCTVATACTGGEQNEQGPVVSVQEASASSGHGWPRGRADARAPRQAQDRCAGCHQVQDGYVRSRDHFLNQRAELSREEWARQADLGAKCGACHQVPEPSSAPQERWGQIVFHMADIVEYYSRDSSLSAPVAPFTNRELIDLVHYFGVFSEGEQSLPSDPGVTQKLFEGYTLGVRPGSGEQPRIGHVNVVDFDRDGRDDVIVSDFNRRAVTLISRGADRWRERGLGEASFPGHTEVVDANEDGRPDLVVAELGSALPTDDRVGKVSLLINEGDLEFTRKTILEGVGRVADARPGDFDGDGDEDFVVAVFGWIKSGGIGWLEQTDSGEYAYHPISSKAGGIHVPPIDLNGDGRLDFIALISQQYEEVIAYVNRGGGEFEPRTLFKADSPTFGSSGIELVDLDQDGDRDVVYTNGDAFDLSPPMILPSHGVQWLENKGNLRFEYHDILRFYGSYRAVTGDLDRDEDLDIVAVSLVNNWANPARKSIIWLENDGSEEFTPHGISRSPTYIISASLGDLDGDGWLDIVTGNMHSRRMNRQRNPMYERIGRVTYWKNIGSE